MQFYTIDQLLNKVLGGDAINVTHKPSAEQVLNMVYNPSYAALNVNILNYAGGGGSVDLSGYYTKTETDNIAATKLAVADVVDSLTSTETAKPLSAAQGKALKTLIDNIVVLLGSDNVNLDTLQEIVDFIELNRATLETLGISNIAGLQNALDAKAAAGHNHDSIYAAIGHTHTKNQITDFPTFKTINGENIEGTGNLVIGGGTSIAIETTSAPVFGLLYNLTDDLYKRIGKNINPLTIDGFNEFSAWRSPTAERQNDADTASPSPLTAWLDSTANLPYSGIGRYVIDNTGAVIKKYNADSYTHADQTGITTTQQVMCPIPLHQYISARIVDGGKTYFLYMVAKNAFTVNAITDLGFVSPTITVWNPTTGVSSGTVAANNIASATSLAHVATSGILPTAAYGAFNAVNGRSICGSGVKATGNITRAQARTQCQAFGANFNQIDFFLESTKNILVLIERGSFYMERGGASMANKWEGYSWNSSGSSNDQDNGKTLALLDRTGVILDGSNRTIANSWRGIENYHSALWRWVDGVNLASNVVYLAKRRAAFDDTSTATNGYFSSGYTVPSGASASYISDLGAGSFIPTAVSGA
ncbi:MAG: hypothetical protein PHE67_12995, partial [Campylobacterales bacterium]|nr:hypothetical protein [Campylobacterales bacterium]